VTDRWTVVATLADASRRALYDYVRRQDHPVGREEAADATSMSRGLAAFHLDKLVDAGLLHARYQAPADLPRGRGRAPKVYEVHGDGLAITIPERRYELIADILAEAVTEPTAGDGEHRRETAARVAYRRGHELGAAMRSTGAGIVDALAGLGFEPQPQNGTVRLRNCPFHTLASRHTALVCGLNHSFVTGIVDGIGATAIEARLAPGQAACCVRLTTPPG
jgi:predicted ArsR family transcriptional regulator